MSAISLIHSRIAVVGLGASGLAAVQLARVLGAQVTAFDAKPLEALAAASVQIASFGAVLCAGATSPDLTGFDVVVVSPGVPPGAYLDAAEAAGVDVCGEVEFAVRALQAANPGTSVVAVGGTNGKSTVTSLLGEMFSAHHERVFVGGNLGQPLAAVATEAWYAVVLEVSSFQMERVRDFAPRASVLLNVTEDHLDRYAGMAEYAYAKGNAFAKQGPTDLAVSLHGDAVCRAQAARGRARQLTFGSEGTVTVSRDGVHDGRDGERYTAKEIKLQGAHNLANVAAAIAVARDMDVPASLIRTVLARFDPLPHRTVFVCEIAGVRYYDDSKGTNVGASVTALRGLFEPRVVLIAGGRDKGGSYAPLVDAIAEKARAVITLGEAAPLIQAAVGARAPVLHASTMREAVHMAQAVAQQGDAVLLSPACSSFDMYASYKYRGDHFCAEVHELSLETR